MAKLEQVKPGLQPEIEHQIRQYIAGRQPYVSGPDLIEVLMYEVDALRATTEAQALVIAQYREALLTRESNPEDDGDLVVCMACGCGWAEGDLPHHATTCILATPPTAAVEQAAAVLKAGEALEDAANRHYWAYEDFDGEDDPRWRQVHAALASAESAYRRARLALRPAPGAATTAGAVGT